MTISVAYTNVVWDGSNFSCNIVISGLPLDVSNLRVDFWNQGFMILNRAPITLLNGVATLAASGTGFIFEDPTTVETMVLAINTNPISVLEDDFRQINITHAGQNVGPLNIMLEYCGEAITDVILTPADYVALQNNIGIFDVLDASTGQTFGNTNEPLTTSPPTQTYSQVAAIIAANSAGGGASCQQAANSNNRFDIFDIKPTVPVKLNSSPIILSPNDYPTVFNYISAGLGTSVQLQISNGSMVSTLPNNTSDGIITMIQNYVDGVIGPALLQTPFITGVVDNDQISVDLSWPAVTGANVYSIQRSSDNGSSWQTIVASQNGQVYRDPTVLANQTYMYRITAANTTTLQTSSVSNDVSITMPSAPVQTVNQNITVTGWDSQVLSGVISGADYQAVQAWIVQNGLLGGQLQTTGTGTTNPPTVTAAQVEQFFQDHMNPNGGTTGTTGNPSSTSLGTMELIAAAGLAVAVPVGVYLFTHGHKKKGKKID